MAKQVSVDTRQLWAHTYELRAAGPVATSAVYAVTKLHTQRLQSIARSIVSGSKHWWALAPHITRETSMKGTWVQGAVGYERPPKGQAKLAHLAEYGSAKSGPLRPHLGPAADMVEETFDDAILSAAVTSLGKGVTRMGRVKAS